MEDNEINEILNSIEQPAESRAMTSEPAEPTVQQAQEYEFVHNGKQIKAPIDNILKWAQQGYDYPQKMQELNKQRAEAEKFRQEHEALIKRYREVDDYAAKNPDWWKYVEENYSNHRNENKINDPRLDELLSWKSQVEQERQKEIAANEDKKLQEEIDAIGKKYPDLDLKQIDESGMSLENRVIQYAYENGYTSFSKAFRDYNFDRVREIAENKAKDSMAKDMQKKAKSGFIGKTPTPTKGLEFAQDVRSKSYNSILEDVYKEYGLRN